MKPSRPASKPAVTFLRCFALLHWGIHLWCSRTPIGRSIRRLSTLSGSCVPFLLLSVAASWPLLFLLCVGSPCVCDWSCPRCSAFSLATSPLLASGLVCVWLLSLVLRSGTFAIFPAVLLLGSIAYELFWLCRILVLPCYSCRFAVFPPSLLGCVSGFVLFGWPLVGGCALLWLAPLLFVWVGEVGPGPEPWTGLHCSELHWRWPVLLSALQSRAPASSKVCKHGSFCADMQRLFCKWYTQWVSAIWSANTAASTAFTAFTAGCAGTMTPWYIWTVLPGPSGWTLCQRGHWLCDCNLPCPSQFNV